MFTHEVYNWVCLTIYVVTLLFHFRFAYTDTYKGFKIYNKDVLAYAVFVIPFFVYQFAYNWIHFEWAAMILFLNPVIIWLFVAWFLFGKLHAIGGGDVKVLLLMTLIMPWYDYYWWLLAANILALVIHYAFSLKTKVKVKNAKSPFGVSMLMCWAVYLLMFINANFVALW